MTDQPLWHYTCACGHSALRRDSLVRPISELANPAKLARLPAEILEIMPLSWFTDLDVPNAEALGLTRQVVRCDRTQFRWLVTADVPRPVPYLQVRAGLPRLVTAHLENAPGAMPRHWWVARTPIPVVYDPRRPASAA